MDIFKFAMTVLKKEYKKNVLYAITLLFAIVISFVFCGIMENPWLVATDKATGGVIWQMVSVPLSQGLPFIIICFCCFVILFASNFYLTHKIKEFALLSTSGLNAIDITKYVTYQICMLLVLITPIALLLGTMLLFLVNTVIYEYVSISHSAYDIPLSIAWYTVLLLLAIILIVILVTGGFLYRNDIQSLLNRNQKINTVNLKEKESHWFLVSFYVLGVILMCIEKHSPTVYIVPTGIGMIGLIALVKQGIPKLLSIWKKGRGLERKYDMIYISNLSSSIQNATFLIMCMVILITAMLPILITQPAKSNEYMTGIFSYIVIVILIIICIVYKLCIHMQSRQIEYRILWNIGYTKKELQIVARKEMLLFYIIMATLPLPYVLTIGIRFIIYSNISAYFLLGYVLAYGIPMIIALIVTYAVYNITVIKPLQQVT